MHLVLLKHQLFFEILFHIICMMNSVLQLYLALAFCKSTVFVKPSHTLTLNQIKILTHTIHNYHILPLIETYIIAKYVEKKVLISFFVVSYCMKKIIVFLLLHTFICQTKYHNFPTLHIMHTCLYTYVKT